ncbi:hypothetical protein CRUP_034413 [Coryphaenoides rupestris]|nr:hypothetical protein CRUP_034413 [Coryphaenoides rupestris]
MLTVGLGGKRKISPEGRGEGRGVGVRGQMLLGLTFLRLLSSSSSCRILTSLVASSSFSRRSSSCCLKNIRSICRRETERQRPHTSSSGPPEAPGLRAVTVETKGSLVARIDLPSPFCGAGERYSIRYWRAICRVFQRDTPVVTSRFRLPRNTTRFTRTLPERGSISLRVLSLQLVASRLPSVLKDMLRITSVWQSIIFTGSPTSRFQISTCSYPALKRMPLLVGCHSTRPTRRLWPYSSSTASGFTGRVTWDTGTTMKEPPPELSVTMARNLELTAQKWLSWTFLVMGMPSKQCSRLATLP